MKRLTCKKCNGDMVYNKTSRGTRFICLLATAGIMMWIPVIGWIGAPICFIFAFLSLLLPTTYTATCKDCKTVVAITKEQYEEVMK